ncbi:MAG: LysR family transcriptional regulator [Chloroflexota bacterium]
MELRLLRYFLAVAEEGSVTRAAGRVAVAQPSLSRQLRGLEAELGVALFDRSARALRLSPAGEAFLPMARDLVARADRAVATMALLGAERAVPLTLVAPETTVADVIAPFLAGRAAGAPVIDVREALPAEVFEAVRAGAADVGVSSGAAPVSLSVRPVASFPIWAYVPLGHPWAMRARVRVAELVTEPLIVLGPSHGTRRLLDAAVAAGGQHYRVAAETNVPQVAQALAAGGRGVAVVSDDPRYGLVPLAIGGPGGRDLRIPLVAAWDPSHYAAAAIEALVASLAAYAAARSGAEAGGGGRRS